MVDKHLHDIYGNWTLIISVSVNERAAGRQAAFRRLAAWLKRFIVSAEGALSTSEIWLTGRMKRNQFKAKKQTGRPDRTGAIGWNNGAEIIKKGKVC